MQGAHEKSQVSLVTVNSGESATLAAVTLAVSGPTAFRAPELPQDLALALLDRIGPSAPARVDGHRTAVRFDLLLPRLLTFSFALTAEVVAALAPLGAFVFVLREEGVETPLQRFDRAAQASSPGADCDRCNAAFALSGDALDPAVVTAALGIEPTTADRAGEPIGPGKRIAARGRWALKVESEPASDINALALGILSRLPAPSSWQRLRQEGSPTLHVGFTRNGLTGYFELSIAVTRELVRAGAALSFWFGNYDA
jgi:uncharacterized protein DUF4279